MQRGSDDEVYVLYGINPSFYDDHQLQSGRTKGLFLTASSPKRPQKTGELKIVTGSGICINTPDTNGWVSWVPRDQAQDSNSTRPCEFFDITEPAQSSRGTYCPKDLDSIYCNSTKDKQLGFHRMLSEIEGTRSVLVIRVSDNFGDAPTKTAAQLSSDIFGSHDDSLNLVSIKENC